MNKKHQRLHVSVSLNKLVVDDNFDWKICAWKFLCLHKASKIMKFSGGEMRLHNFCRTWWWSLRQTITKPEHIQCRDTVYIGEFLVRFFSTNWFRLYGIEVATTMCWWKEEKKCWITKHNKQRSLLAPELARPQKIVCGEREKTVENEERMRKMFRRNKCKVNEPHAKLEHRLFYDFMLRRWIGGSRSLYDHFVRKLNLERKKRVSWMKMPTRSRRW